MSMIASKLLLWCQTTPMSGLMVALPFDQVTGGSSSGAVFFFAHQSVDFWNDRWWGHVDHVRPEGEVQSCRFLFLFLGLSSLFRELRCGVSF